CALDRERGRRCRGARRARRPSRRGAPEKSARHLVSPRADRRPAHACPVPRTVRNSKPSRRMRDERAIALARILVAYSCAVEEGDVCLIQGESATQPLALAVYEEVLKAGGLPVVDLTMSGQGPAFFKHASDKQLEWVSPTAEWGANEVDVRFRLIGDTNTRELSGVEPSRQTRRQAAVKPLMEKMMERSAAGELRWGLTLFPTEAYASEADMSLADYEDFYYRACLCDQPDPIAAWKQASEETRRLADWINGKEEIRLEGPGTDLTLNVSGRTFIAADGHHN